MPPRRRRAAPGEEADFGGNPAPFAAEYEARYATPRFAGDSAPFAAEYEVQESAPPSRRGSSRSNRRRGGPAGELQAQDPAPYFAEHMVPVPHYAGNSAPFAVGHEEHYAVPNFAGNSAPFAVERGAHYAAPRFAGDCHPSAAGHEAHYAAPHFVGSHDAFAVEQEAREPAPPSLRGRSNRSRRRGDASEGQAQEPEPAPRSAGAARRGPRRPQAPGEGGAPQPGPGSMFSGASIERALRLHVQGVPATRLVRGSWLLERARQAEARRSAAEREQAALPCRQRLEEEAPEAYLSAEEVMTLRVRAGETAEPAFLLVALSYCWLCADHPDPEAFTLISFARAVRREWSPRTCTNRAGGGKGVFPQGEFAVFWDWLSMCQRVDGRDRTPADQAAFKAAMGDINLWYAHQLTTVFCLYDLPMDSRYVLEAEYPVHPYEMRGWTTYERAVSLFVKPGNFGTWQRSVDVRGTGTRMANGRDPPTEPKAFEQLLRTKHWTQPADTAMVAQKYLDAVTGCLGESLRVDFSELLWKDGQAQALAQVLGFYREAESLNLNGSLITAVGTEALAQALLRGAMPMLRVLQMPRSRMRDAGAEELAKLPRKALQNLEALDLWNCGITDRGAVALGRALLQGRMPNLRALQLFSARHDWACEDLLNDIGQEGLHALAEARDSRPDLTIWAGDMLPNDVEWPAQRLIL